MSLFSGIKYLPDSKPYITAYIKFYARRIGKKPEECISESEDDETSVKAKAHLLDSLYKNLDTLDNKAAVLLTFCGLALASVAFLISSTHNVKYLRLVLYLLFIGITVAAVLAQVAIGVHWTNSYELSDRSLEDACGSYYRTRQRRTKIYMSAWLIMIVLMCILGVCMLLDMILG